MEDSPQADASPLKFLALGDSYTIGEGVEEDERWPNVLRESLVAKGIDVATPEIIARTGWTTDELQQAIDNANPSPGAYNMVSLLIGVNNQYRGYPFGQYEKELAELMERAIGFADAQNGVVFMLSIPDYGVTPFASSRDPEKIAAELDAYNAFADSLATANGVLFFNITPISRQAKDNPGGLLAGDQLHPSAEMYRQWVELVLEDISSTLTSL